MRHLVMTAAAAAFSATGAVAQDAPFGSEEDAAYAALLWDVMVAERLAGDNAIIAFPYEGSDPHGMMLETFYTRATVDGHEGRLIVKRNYGPAGVSVDEVLGDPAGHLGAVTVMFQRAEGYDDETGNWFWVKYLPDGSLDKNPAGMQLAGLVGKGADAGCIACHMGAGGEDMIFTTDADVAMMMK
ncbi:cytochrome P460 family protein [Defluviimonas sp. D31]|uniref:cytochrome P460 family protein n=1 Tax=Defluviimonas sp. D31 TaxID=3083253 RepID=UPI00296E34FC|nr:cytochrome P460 family protein [Defluviimonas sp. D31]MDW4548135.1 cytochrome P460 family protein [Defluviimonas sp. D31]